mmetsp:Transcript_16139/g.15521  ORF Transcript_16139/g.15521 Transcript_16139/m.15521 type:complete len:96 (-) Transcript_16139:273-560(-)
MALEVRPALFELKQLNPQRALQSYSSPKNGYICFHFFDKVDGIIDFSQKKTFVLTMKFVRDLLDVKWGQEIERDTTDKDTDGKVASEEEGIFMYF